MPPAHVAGLPLEEALPLLAMPLGVYVAAIAVHLRDSRRWPGSLARRRQRQ